MIFIHPTQLNITDDIFKYSFALIHWSQKYVAMMIMLNFGGDISDQTQL